MRMIFPHFPLSLPIHSILAIISPFISISIGISQKRYYIHISYNIPCREKSPYDMHFSSLSLHIGIQHRKPPVILLLSAGLLYGQHNSQRKCFSSLRTLQSSTRLSDDTEKACMGHIYTPEEEMQKVILPGKHAKSLWAWHTGECAGMLFKSQEARPSSFPSADDMSCLSFSSI